MYLQNQEKGRRWCLRAAFEMYVNDTEVKEDTDGRAGELASAREREGRGDARLHRHRCGRTPATSCRLGRPCLPTVPGARPPPPPLLCLALAQSCLASPGADRARSAVDRERGGATGAGLPGGLRAR
jgi:hypothetical protein